METSVSQVKHVWLSDIFFVSTFEIFNFWTSYFFSKISENYLRNFSVFVSFPAFFPTPEQNPNIKEKKSFQSSQRDLAKKVWNGCRTDQNQPEAWSRWYLASHPVTADRTRTPKNVQDSFKSYKQSNNPKPSDRICSWAATNYMTLITPVTSQRFSLVQLKVTICLCTRRQLVQTGIRTKTNASKINK